jgi:hypothetical protein
MIQRKQKTIEESLRDRRGRFWATIGRFPRDAETGFWYVLEGTYHNGITAVPVDIAGSSLEQCVKSLKSSDPNFGLSAMAFTGGWVCADYDVTAQVRSLV